MSSLITEENIFQKSNDDIVEEVSDNISNSNSENNNLFYFSLDEYRFGKDNNETQNKTEDPVDKYKRIKKMNEPHIIRDKEDIEDDDENYLNFVGFMRNSSKNDNIDDNKDYDNIDDIVAGHLSRWNSNNNKDDNKDDKDDNKDDDNDDDKDDDKDDDNDDDNDDIVERDYVDISKIFSSSSGCTCELCEARRDKMLRYITPIQSYDRSLFPQPDPMDYRMTSVIWAFPKYTEELSVSEFKKKYLDKSEETVEDKANEIVARVSEEILEVETETNDNGDIELICPITTEPIEEIAMTCHGHIYEKSEIEMWMQNHDTDPISGRYLYTKRLITKGIDVKNIRQCQKKIRDNMLILYNYPRELIYPEEIVKQVKATQDYILAFDEKETEIWKQYSLQKKSYFRDPNITKICMGKNKYILQDTDIVRPKNTGKGFEYLDLSGDYFNRYQNIGQSYKGASFNGANLSGNVFIQCQFSRCTFIGANIASCIFHGCSFLGEEVNFAGATSSDETQFIDCRVEDIGSWTAHSDIDLVKRCLNNRLLKESFEVISVGSFDE